MRAPVLLRLLVPVFTSLVFPGLGAATDRLVPSPFPDVSSAIAAAVDGVDRVVITAGGTYGGYTLNKNIPVLKSTTAEVIIQAGSSDAWAVRIQAVGASVSGLTIRSRLSGSGAVEMAADADLLSCLVQDSGNTFTDGLVTITSTGAGAKVANCKFTIASAVHGPGVRVNASTLNQRTEALADTISMNTTASSMAVGVDVVNASSPPLLEGNIVQATGLALYQSTGVRASVGVEARYNVLENVGLGIVLTAGANHTILTNTVVWPVPSAADGIVIGIAVSSSTSSFSNNLIVNADTAFVFPYCPPPTFWTINHNAYWNPGGTASNCSLSGTQIATDLEPVFCNTPPIDPTEVKIMYTQCIDSPLARGNLPPSWNNELVGARDVAYVWGPLSRNTTVAPGSAVTVLQDVTVPAGKRLTLKENVTFKFDADDDSQTGGGLSSGLNDLWVDGSLIVEGKLGQPVELQAAFGSSEGTWYGIHISQGGKAEIGRAEIRHAQVAITYSSGDTGWVEYSTFSQTGDVEFLPGVSTGGMAFTIKGNLIDVGSGGAVELTEYCSGIIIEDNEIIGSSVSTHGITCQQAHAGGHPNIIGNTISGFTNGAAIRVACGMDPSIAGNTLDGNKYGIQVANGYSLIGTGAAAGSNAIYENITGILADHIQGGAYSAPVIRRNEISGNETGAQAKSGANPNLGTSVADKGNNIFLNNSVACIRNSNKLGVPVIIAQGNYFGEIGCAPPSCLIGAVDASNHLCTPPLSMEVGVGRVETGRSGVSALQVTPNPLVEGGEISFVSVGKAGNVSVKIYDAVGRVTRDLGKVSAMSGKNRMAWDGRNGDGRRVASGLYFVVVAAGEGDSRMSRKLLVMALQGIVWESS